jgi:hypothetical protein
MKKLIVILMLLGLMSVSGVANAQSAELDGNQWNTYIKENTSGVYLTTNVPVTSIYPGFDRIQGYTVMPLGTASENVVAIYDSVSSTLSGEVLGEAECFPESWDGQWFPYPREISNGITIRQGPNTRVIIYFVRG